MNLSPAAASVEWFWSLLGSGEPAADPLGDAAPASAPNGVPDSAAALGGFAARLAGLRIDKGHPVSANLQPEAAPNGRRAHASPHASESAVLIPELPATLMVPPPHQSVRAPELLADTGRSEAASAVLPLIGAADAELGRGSVAELLATPPQPVHAPKLPGQVGFAPLPPMKTFAGELLFDVAPADPAPARDQLALLPVADTVARADAGPAASGAGLDTAAVPGSVDAMAMAAVVELLRPELSAADSSRQSPLPAPSTGSVVFDHEIAQWTEEGELTRASIASTRTLLLDPHRETALHAAVHAAQPIQVNFHRGRTEPVRAQAAWKLSAREMGSQLAASAIAGNRHHGPAQSPGRFAMVAEHESAEARPATARSAAPPTPPDVAEPLTPSRDQQLAAATVLPLTPSRPDRAEHPEESVGRSAQTQSPVQEAREPLLDPMRTSTTQVSNTTEFDLGTRLRLAIAETIVAEGRDRLLGSVREGFEARITVSPAHLGTVSIIVNGGAMAGGAGAGSTGGLSVLLVAAHQDAARALEAEVDELVDELVRHRLEVNDVQVRRGNGSPAESQREAQQRSASQDANERDRRDAEQTRQREEEREPRGRRDRAARWEFAERRFFDRNTRSLSGSDPS